MFNLHLKPAQLPTERCFVFGEDSHIEDKALVSTGAFFLDKPNRFAYDSVPECIGVLLRRDKNGKLHVEGQCAILYENSAQAYLFEKGEWADKCQSKEILLEDGRSEAIGMVAGEIETDYQWERWMPVLYIALGILALVTIIVCAGAGLFNNVKEAFV